MTESGRALQVVEVAANKSYRLDEAALREVLMRDDIRDLPVAVVSLAGAYRGGKSFMLNFFLRYLKSPVSARQDGSWIGNKYEVLGGFSWRAGVTRNTTGILLWSEPLITTVPNGDKVAVLLMDTQGTFDNKSTLRDSATIFALSTLISSVQIYNLPGGGGSGIREDDLQHLLFFTEYGKLVSDEQGSKAFQVLEFLVRDWGNEFEYPFGNVGGQKYLDQEVMKVTSETPNELRELRAQLLASFEKVTCFLMPYPGRNVRKPEFTGSISEMEPEFVSNLRTFASSILSAEKLKIKLINGRPTKAGELFTYFKTYIGVFNSNMMPNATSILEAMRETGLLLAKTAALEQYEAAMEAYCGTKTAAVPAAMVKAAHQRELRAACSTFSETKKLALHEQAGEYLKRIITDINNQERFFMSMNMSKTQSAINDATKLYHKTLLDISGDRPLCVHDDDVSKIQDEAVTAAVALFDSKRMRMLERDDERDDFIDTFKLELHSLKLLNETNNRMAIANICDEYSDSMQEKSMQEPPVSSAEFESEHRAALARALVQFNERRTRLNKYQLDKYKTLLTNTIEKKYKNYESTNKGNNKGAMYAALNKYTLYMTNTHKPSAGKCYHPSALDVHHNNGKCAALKYLRPRLVCGHGRMSGADDDGDVQTLAKMIEDTYTGLRDQNDVANRSIVYEALILYKSNMNERCYPTLWWLLIIPAYVYMAELPGNHNHCKTAALARFNSKRDNNVVFNHSPDYYRNYLNQEIQKAYQPFKHGVEI